MSTVRAKLLFALVCAFGLAACSNSGIYLGTTVGAPWGGVSIGTTVPIGHGRPCCWDDEEENPDDAPAPAETADSLKTHPVEAVRAASPAVH